MNKATQDISKMSLNAAWAVGDIVKRKIQEEFNKTKKGGDDIDQVISVRLFLTINIINNKQQMRSHNCTGNVLYG